MEEESAEDYSEYVNMKQLAPLMGKSESTLYGWIKKGTFPASTHTRGQEKLWIKEEVVAWKKENIGI